MTPHNPEALARGSYPTQHNTEALTRGSTQHPSEATSMGPPQCHLASGSASKTVQVELIANAREIQAELDEEGLQEPEKEPPEKRERITAGRNQERESSTQTLLIRSF
jgi:hypothetical protein